MLHKNERENERKITWGNICKQQLLWETTEIMEKNGIKYSENLDTSTAVALRNSRDTIDMVSSSLPLSTVQLSAVSVTCSQLQSEKITWKFPEINSS